MFTYRNNPDAPLFTAFILVLVAALIVIGGLVAAFFMNQQSAPAQQCPGGVCPVHSIEYSAAVPLSVASERPVVNLPASLRQNNWKDPGTGSGSCWHASLKSIMNWQHQTKLKAWWPYQGGEYADRGHKRLDAAGVKYAATTSGDVRVLEWMLRTRRGAVITYWPAHAVNLVHLDEQWAGVLDNNRTQQIIWIPRREFIPNWQRYGGWATSLVYAPSPPIPRR